MKEALRKWQQEHSVSLSFSLQVETVEDLEKYRKFIDKKKIPWLVTRQDHDLEKIDALIALRPQAIILQVEDDLQQDPPGLRSYEEQLDCIAQMALRAKSKGIATHIMIDPIPHRVMEVAKLGVELVWLSAAALETKEDIGRYVTCARIAVDLGVKIGIGPGFALDQLNGVLKGVPHIDVLMFGRQFFAEFFCKGVTTNLKTYLKQIQNY